MATIGLSLLLALCLGASSRSSPTSGSDPLQRQSRGSCPEGWLDLSIADMGCIYLDESKARRSFDAAVQACYGHDPGSHVVEIHSQEQQDFLVMALKAIDGAAGKGRWWWNGATDENNEGIFCS